MDPSFTALHLSRTETRPSFSFFSTLSISSVRAPPHIFYDYENQDGSSVHSSKPSEQNFEAIRKRNLISLTHNMFPLLHSGWPLLRWNNQYNVFLKTEDFHDVKCVALHQQSETTQVKFKVWFKNWIGQLANLPLMVP